MIGKNIEIPFYDLYGESFLNLSADFVHLEDIRSRSADLGWEISLHRHDKLLQIVCVFDNNWTVHLDGRTLRLSGDWVVTIPPGVIHGFSFSPYTYGYVLSINSDVINEISLGGEIAELTQNVWTAQSLEFKEKSQSQRFIKLLKLLLDEMKSTEMGNTVTINLLLKLIFIDITRRQQAETSQHHLSGRDAKILLGFRELIDLHYNKHWSVSDYASRLYVSVSTLSRLCKHHLRTPPKKIVHQKLINEAKRRLIYTRQSLDEIALTLGFKDTAYFCRFFKQVAGITAGEYRKNSSL